MVDHEAQYLDLLKKLVAIPSVSAKRTHLGGTAQLIGDSLQALGAAVEIDNTYFAPLVIGHLQSKQPHAKTLLIYNHYDVQPAEPFDLWDSDPWQLTEVDKTLYGRGVNDDKGNFTARLTAVADYLSEHSEGLPVNITFLVEGSEETASQHLDDYLARHPELKADLIIWESGNRQADGRLEIIGGNKGIVTFNISAKIGQSDLHSSWASIIDSAIWRLTAGLNTLRDFKGHITIPQLDADIQQPNQRELDLIEQVPLNRAAILKDFQLEPYYLANLPEQELKKKLYFEPTLNVEGISGGYQGDGVKTVLPATASAKLDLRLVPGMDPDQTITRLQKCLVDNGYADLTVVKTLGQKGYRSDMSNPAILKVISLAESIYGHAPLVLPTSPGTGPMAYIHDAISAPIVGIGIGNSQSKDHAPNENIYLADYRQHIQLMQAIIASYQ